MSKIVYLLGAGASYGKRVKPEDMTMDDVSYIMEGLPVVNEINDELNYVIGKIDSVELNDGNFKLRGVQCGADALKEELIDGFEWLLRESSRHATIDTFAKKLYLKNDINNYGRLKFLLSSFFFIEQNLHPYDKRYDTFLANILNKDLEVMDSTAAAICKDNKLKLIVFNMNKRGNIAKACNGEKIGTIVRLD